MVCNSLVLTMSIEDNKDLNGARRDIENLSLTTTQKKAFSNCVCCMDGCNSEKCQCHTQKVERTYPIYETQKPLQEGVAANYVDSRTPEEVADDLNIEVVMTSTVAPTPSINEIIKDRQLSDLIFLEINRAGTSATRGTLNPEIHHQTIMKSLTFYRQSIYKELIDAIEARKKKSHPYIPDEHTRVDTFNEGLDDATQIIKQKQSEI